MSGNSMENIRIITDKKELAGTCYMEILPGPYQNQCWNDGSLFFDEDAFDYIEPIIQRHVPVYDHYAFTEISSEQWHLIADDLDRLAHEAVAAINEAEFVKVVDVLLAGLYPNMIADFYVKRHALAQLATSFAEWIREKITDYNCITILGI